MFDEQQYGLPGSQISSKVIVTGVYLVGLLLYSFPPFVIRAGSTRLLRLDWVLSVPILAYFVISKRNVLLTRASLFACGFVAVASIGIMLGDVLSPVDFLTAFTQLVYAVGLFIVLISLRFSTDEFRSVLRIWILLLIIVAVYGTYQALALNLGLPLSDPTFGYAPPSAQTGGYARPAAVFGEPSFYAAALVTGIAAIVPCVASRDNVLFSRRFQATALIILSTGLATSGSIRGYLVAVFGVGLFLLIPDTRAFASRFVIGSLPMVALGASAGILFGVPLVSTVLERLSKGLSVLVGPIPPGFGSIYVRYGRSLAGLEAFEQAPIFGTGLGQYATWAVGEEFTAIRQWLLSSRPLTRIHGGWVQVLAMTGLTGLLAFAGTWFSVLRSAIRTLVRVSGEERTLILAGIALTALQLFDWLFGFSLIHPYRWGLTGIVLSLIVHLQEDA